MGGRIQVGCSRTRPQDVPAQHDGQDQHVCRVIRIWAGKQELSEAFDWVRRSFEQGLLECLRTMHRGGDRAMGRTNWISVWGCRY